VPLLLDALPYQSCSFFSLFTLPQTHNLKRLGYRGHKLLLLQTITLLGHFNWF
jgi:hypothetical protein